MFDKIKRIMQNKEAVDELSSRVGEQSFRLDVMAKENSELKREFSEIREELRYIAKAQRDITEELQGNISLVTESRQRLEREVDDFKIMKSRLQQSLFEQLSEEYRKELLVAIERLKADVASFNSLKQEIFSIAARTTRLAGEIDKLTAISSKIRKEDFELHQYAAVLQRQENEKIRLLRQIDALERLVSRERRKKSTTF